METHHPVTKASFGTFASYSGEERGTHHWLAALASSSVIYVLLAVAAVAIGTTARTVMQEKPVEVTFVEKVLIEPPPPPPPMPDAKPAPPPAAAAPVVRPDQKIRKLDKPPPPKELLAPKEVPKEVPQEADPSLDQGVAVYGEGEGDPAGLEGGQAGGVAGGMVGGAIALPEDANPPVPDKANPIPDYPADARVAGKTGMVILKVIILADGSVGDVQLMRGDEPFASSAVKAVKGWKYAPARHKGQPITVYRIIQIPFKLNV